MQNSAHDLAYNKSKGINAAESQNGQSCDTGEIKMYFDGCANQSYDVEAVSGVADWEMRNLEECYICSRQEKLWPERGAGHDKHGCRES